MFSEDFADIFEHQATPQFALVEEVVDAVLRTNESEGPIRGEFLDDALHDVPLHVSLACRTFGTIPVGT